MNGIAPEKQEIPSFNIKWTNMSTLKIISSVYEKGLVQLLLHKSE